MKLSGGLLLQSYAEKGAVIASAFLIDIFWTAFVLLFITKVLDLNVVGYITAMPFGLSNIGGGWTMFFLAVVLAPLWEEAVFRYFPLSIAKGVDKKYTWPIVVLSSIIFGLAHGSVINILIQGVSGFLLAGVYIKNGFSYRSSVCYHALWNGMVMFILPFLTAA